MPKCTSLVVLPNCNFAEKLLKQKISQSRDDENQNLFKPSEFFRKMATDLHSLHAWVFVFLEEIL